MTAFISVVCANPSCGKQFNARRADRRRGWAKFCSKSCKAFEQEGRTGQYAELIHKNTPRVKGKKIEVSLLSILNEKLGHVNRVGDNENEASEGFQMTPEELSFGGHGDSDEFTPFGDGKW